VHSERSGKLTDAPPDPSIADDADRGAIKPTLIRPTLIRPTPMSCTKPPFELIMTDLPFWRWRAPL
jgi:hypothetical protein